MPVVQYDAPRVQQAPLRGGENTSRADPTNAGQFMLALGRGVSDLGEVGARIQERRDLDDAFRVETKVLSDYNEFENNLRKTRRGANAKDVVNDVDQWWGKIDQTYGTDVSPRAKELAKKSLTRARMQSLDTMGRYQMGEEDRSQSESFFEANKQEVQRAIVNGDPAVIAESKKKISDAINTFGATRGWGADQLAGEKLKWNNAMNIQAIGQMVDSNKPMDAKRFFEANRADIDTSHHKTIKDMIEKKVSEVNATDNAAKWASLPFEDAIANASKITDPVERRLTVQAVKELQQEKNIATSLREKAASDSIWQMVRQGVPQRKLPETVLRQMDGKESLQVQDWYRADAKHRAADAEGKAIKTDPAVYGRVLDLLRDNAEKTHPEAYAAGLSRGDLKSLLDHRDQILRKPASAADTNAVASPEQQMNTYISTLRLKDDTKGAFQKAGYDEIATFKRTNGREPNFDERQKIFDRLVVESKHTWSSNVKVFEIPLADRTQIIEALRKRGQPPTGENILKLYEASE